MAKTKERILDTALQLFNERGLAAVTLRTIANEMGISQGNLNYHYKTRQDIVEGLYHRLVVQMSTIVAAAGQSMPSDLAAIFEQSKEIMGAFYNYRFLMLDFVQIMRVHPSIHAHYQELTQLRAQQFATIFEQWTQAGIMLPEVYVGQYKALYQRQQIMGDYWLSAAITTHTTLSNQMIGQYCNLIFQALYPYLTEKGQAEFRVILALGVDG